MDAAILKNSKSAYCRTDALMPAAAAEFSMAAGCQSAQHKNLLL